ncbi:GNAT family N-acetyltransferase [Ferruginibacter sp.]|nr:GNAT family N-acetyltransferase [Ferruginibacter sp.]
MNNKIELREYSLQYASAFAEMRNNPKIFENGFDSTPNPYTTDVAIELFQKQIDKQTAERFLIFCNEQLCGEIGIWLKDDVQRLNVDLGYFVAEPFWGKGIATEAIRLMVDYTFKTFDVIRIAAGVFEHNKASMKALEKNGFILESIQKKAVVKNDRIMDDYMWVKFR